jgi:hypothetical protein
MSSKKSKLELASRFLADLEKEKPKPRVAPAVPSMSTRMAAARKAAMTRAGVKSVDAPKKRSS